MALSDIILAQSGLISFWEGTDAAGSSNLTDGQSAHNGTFAANTLPGMFGFDFQTNGSWKHNGASSNATVTVNDHADFDTLTHSFEICFMLLQHIRGINHTVWTKGSNMPRLLFSETASAATPQIGISGGTITTGTASVTDTYLWHHLAFTCNGTYNSIKIYLDGVDITGSYTVQTISTNANAISLGGGFQPILYSNAAFYNTVLAPADITARWTAVQAQSFRTKKPVMYGVHTDSLYTSSDGVRDSQAATLKSINAKIARSTLLWDKIQTTSGGAYDWSALDEYVRICNQYDIIPWLYSGGSPTWANGGANRWVVPGTGVDSTFQTWVSQYQTFIGDFVDRYKPGGSGTYTIPAPYFWLEMWNEPNLASSWNNAAAGNAPDPNQYAYWYQNVRSTILSHYAEAKVTLGGLSSWSATGAPAIAGEAFLRDIVASPQWSAAPIDYAAYHPYPYNNDPNEVTAFQNHFNDVVAMKTVLTELGYDSAPLCITEVGVKDSTSQADQAAKLTTMMTRVRDQWSQIVPLYVFFCISDDLGANYGLFTSVPTDGTASTSRKTASLTYSGIAQPDSYWGLKA